VNIKFIDEIDNLAGKRVFIKTDLNVPQDEKLQISNDFRIKAALPTIEYAIEKRAKVIVASHLGRPLGEKRAEFSLKAVAKQLGILLEKEVRLAPDCVGLKVEEMIAEMAHGEILMLENLRFHKSETKNDPDFSMQLAKLADIYVDDAFGSAHRAHSSNVGITHYVKTVAGGLLLKNEIINFERYLHQPKRPFKVIFGGAKASKKLKLIVNILSKADQIIIGGAMAFFFLKAAGKGVGNCKLDDELVILAKQIIETAKEKQVHLLLPTDMVVAAKAGAGKAAKVVSADQIPNGCTALDIGPETLKRFKLALNNAKTIVWNGPMGKFELNEFADGTTEIGKYLVEVDAAVVVGGGDTVAATHSIMGAKNVSYISTGGIALLEMLGGKELPGIAALGRRILH